jgi:tetratricopeptide (TPR) repeat protein
MVTEGLNIFRQEQDPFYTAEGLLYLGMLWGEKEDHAQSWAYFEESLALRRQIHDRDGMGICLQCMGQVALFQGEYALAHTLLNESGECFRQAGNQARLARVYSELSRLYLAQGEYPQAAQSARQALAIGQEIDNRPEITRASNTLGLLAWARGDTGQARTHCQEAERMAGKIGSNLGGAFAQYILGRVALTQGELEGAASLLVPLLAEANRQKSDSLEIARLLDSLAGLASEQGQWVRAATIFGANEAAYRRLSPSLAPVERSEHAAWLMAARQALGAQAFASAWEAGQGMTLDQVKAVIIP